MTNPEIAKYDDMVEELLHLKRVNADLTEACDYALSMLRLMNQDNDISNNVRACLARVIAKATKGE